MPDLSFLLVCCGLGGPLIVGAMLLLLRDREGSRLEREIRRLNTQSVERPTRRKFPATSAGTAQTPAGLAGGGGASRQPSAHAGPAVSRRPGAATDEDIRVAPERATSTSSPRRRQR